MKEIIIKGCENCPMCDMNDSCAGYSCQLMPSTDNYIKESKQFRPITPEWCPLKYEDIVFKFEKSNLITK